MAVNPTAPSLACLRIGVFVTADAARLATGVGGSPFTGRVSHPLDGKQSFMTSPHRHSPLTSLAWSHRAPTPTPDTTVYDIRPGRSFDDAVAVLGADFAGVLVRDGWAPYRRFTNARHQSCLAHLLRRCRTLRADHPRSPWAARVHRPDRRPGAPRSARCASDPEHGLAVARGRLLARLGRLIDSATLPAAQRFLDSRPCSPSSGPSTSTRPTRAEHAIRPAVVTLWRQSHAAWRADPTDPRAVRTAGNAVSTSTTSSPRCSKPHGRWSPPPSNPPRSRITR